MSALNDLQGYEMAVREIEAIERQMERMLPTGGPSIMRGIGGGGGTNDPTAAAMQQADGIEQVLAVKRAKLWNLAIRGERALELVEDARERFVLRSYYMLGMTDQQIADAMYRSRSGVQQIRAAAEEKLSQLET